jgi:hypothetical protein
MITVREQIVDAMNSGRSDRISAAVHRWLHGLSTSDELNFELQSETTYRHASEATALAISDEEKPTAKASTSVYSSTTSVLTRLAHPEGAK